MSVQGQPVFSGPDELRAKFRELSIVEEDFKRDLAWAQQNLLGVRELKAAIHQQIFSAAVLADGHLPLPNAATTSQDNGPTHD